MTATLASGTIVDRYRIAAHIAGGSMGDVYLAYDDELARKVALKLLSDRHRDNEELRARFAREARAVAAISHRNVVQVFTTGHYAGLPFFAMEFLDGIDLASDVERYGPFRSLDAVRAGLDAAYGLHAAARAGLIHRDVKPSNLVRVRDGHVKVTDFGLAKPIAPAGEPALTATGVVVGTPDYIAPEQARGQPIDERVDIYALGGTLYNLVTGTPPFRTGRKKDDEYLRVVARHLRQPAPDPREKNPAIDCELAQLVRAMMAKQPAARPGYDELIGRLIALGERLRRESDPPARQGTDQPRARTADPTPFVGGPGPRAPDLVARANQGEFAPRPAAAEAEVVGRAQSPPRSAALPLWVIAFTIFCALVFALGLSLFLFAPRADSPAGRFDPSLGGGGDPGVGMPAGLASRHRQSGVG